MIKITGDSKTESERRFFEMINELLGDDLKAQLPLRFILRRRPFNIEIQYFLDITNAENSDVASGLFKFAVTTDGFDLLVNTNSQDLEVLQDEFGFIDSLGISFMELVEADKERL
jgi:hypothetical protein